MSSLIRLHAGPPHRSSSKWAPAPAALLSVLVLTGCAAGSDEPETSATTSAAAPANVFSPAATAGDGGLMGSTTGFMPVTTGFTSGTSGASTGGTLTGGSTSTTTGFVPVTTGGVTGGAASTGASGGATTGAIGGFTTGAIGGASTGAIGGLTTGATGGTSTGEPLDPSATQPAASKLPQVDGSCPDMSRSGTVQVAGSGVVLTVGSKPGPAYFYFHGTGTSPREVDQAIPGATSSVRSDGGFVASFESSNNMGMNTGTIWYTGDLDAADQLVACGIEAGIVDPGRIHAAGYSAGGLETGSMVMSRAYLASVIVYSGGQPGAGFGLGGGSFPDPTHIPAMLGAHGAAGVDSLGVDFGTATPALGKKIQDAGGFYVGCDDGGGHIALSRLGVGGQAKKFLDEHPYNTKPSPYESGLPSGFPGYCKVGP